MTDDPIRIEFEVTLDEFFAAHLRQMWGSKSYRTERLRASILIGVLWGAIGGGIGVATVAVLLGRPIGVEVLVGVLGGAGLGALMSPLYRPLYDRSVNRRVRDALADLYGPPETPMRCEMELRSGCLWLRQNGVVETAYDWSTLTAVDDTADGVELRFDSLPIVAHNRAFATHGERECFVNRARSSIQTAQHSATTPRPDAAL